MEKNVDISEQPIGIFDSGVGGLTVFAAIASVLPNENLIYLGDTARVPYGSRSPETVLRYAQRVAGHLLNQGVKALIIACNTATTYALEALQKATQAEGIPVIGVIAPGAKHAVNTTENGIIGVLGTEGTIQGGKYEQEIHSLDKNVKVVTTACPLLVPLVEEGWHHDPITIDIIRKYLSLLQEGPDTIILGCTHYPLLKPIFKNLLPHIHFIDSAVATAIESKKVLADYGILKQTQQKEFRFLVTDNMERFKRVGYNFIGQSPTPLELIDLLDQDEQRLRT